MDAKFGDGYEFQMDKNKKYAEIDEMDLENVTFTFSSEENVKADDESFNWNYFDYNFQDLELFIAFYITQLRLFNKTFHKACPFDPK